MQNKLLFVLFVCLSAILCAEVTIDWVTVGDAGNDADNTGHGKVDYEYWIGKYEVTNDQYCEFLNAVAATDTYYLYNGSMDIQRSGSSGSYTYTVISGRGSLPVRYVSWMDALRFVNWLHNGKQGAGTTENGAYQLNDYNSYRLPGAKYWLPNVNEWYKAAYYKGGGTSAGYYNYAASSDDQPTREMPAGGTNSANYSYVMGSSPYTSTVGAYSLSVSPYGTHDQCGNVGEWTETSSLSYPDSKQVRGGSYYNSSYLDASSYELGYYLNDCEYVGFRLAAHINTIEPEPFCTNYPKADFNKDCRVNLTDFAEFAGEWLTCNWDPPSECLE